ncbi:uncharacterized protein LOC132270258 [Cornus florida]|uniref:uncharacterized protein LOC132270258 n=1 Tax=Cornus florida TaxID=4283 RepID=UPI0028A1CA9B|nr:uncharacterized protein LOC132270258 [Cornus florida]
MSIGACGAIPATGCDGVLSLSFPWFESDSGLDSSPAGFVGSCGSRWQPSLPSLGLIYTTTDTGKDVGIRDSGGDSRIVVAEHQTTLSDLTNRLSKTLLSRESRESTGWIQDDICDEGNSECSIKNSEEEREIVMDEISHHRMVGRSHEEAEAGDTVDMKKKMKRGWLKKLNVLSRITNRQGEESLKPSDFNLELGTRVRRVRVHLHGKRSKELSSLYAGQEFSAHKGSILTMKFSPDGQYLASAGEDNVVRVWKVMEYERPNQFDIQDTDPSCLYFLMDHLSKFAHLDVDKNKIGRMKRLRKSTESACVIFPSKSLSDFGETFT